MSACNDCPTRWQRIRNQLRALQGLGDLIAWALDKIGIGQYVDCDCENRQRLLNRLVPFKKRKPTFPG